MVGNTVPTPDPALPSRYDDTRFLVVFAPGVDPPSPELEWGSISTQSDGWLKFWRADSPDSVVYPPSSILFVDHRYRPPVIDDAPKVVGVMCSAHGDTIVEHFLTTDSVARLAQSRSAGGAEEPARCLLDIIASEQM